MSETKPYHGMWDFAGSCAPVLRPDGTYQVKHGFETFTLGCFQWQTKSSGRGLKQGKVQHRIKGRAHDPEAAFAAARTYCDQKNRQAS